MYKSSSSVLEVSRLAVVDVDIENLRCVLYVSCLLHGTKDVRMDVR